ncbi:MAG TPA: hypothetical protein VM328_11630 [Fimbriimonadaceae bacterium]|nr:hypothetical protein [Fimbriimonadaceae bacterium]
MAVLAVEEELVVLPSAGELVWGFFVIPVLLGLALWARTDMNRRGQPGWIWGLMVFFAPVVGILLWLALRRNWPRVEREVDESAGTRARNGRPAPGAGR